MNERRVAAEAPLVSFALPFRAGWSDVWLVLLGAWLAVGAAMQPRAGAITITMEYTDEGDPTPHPENPSWDPAGTILKAHFNHAKQIWEQLLPGPGSFEFDFHWDDDIDGLGLTTKIEPFDTYVEINPIQPWYVDPYPLTDDEFSTAARQTLYSGLSASDQTTYFLGTPPPGALETGYVRNGMAGPIGAAGYHAGNGADLLSTVVHEMGHVLGIDHNVLGDVFFEIDPQFIGGTAGVLIPEGEGGHLPGGVFPGPTPGSFVHIPGFLMCDGCGLIGTRRYPTATDVLVIANEEGINDVFLPRVGRISSGLWSESGAWIGADAPNFPQDAYITHGGTVTLDGNASAKDLLVAGGNNLLVGGNSLDLGGNLTFATGATVSVGTGGTISAQDIIRGSSDLTTAAGSLVWFNSYSGGGGPTANFNGSVRIGNNGNTSPPTTFNPDTINAWTIAEEMAIDSGNGNIGMVIDNDADFTSASGRIGPATGVGVAPNVTISTASRLPGTSTARWRFHSAM